MIAFIKGKIEEFGEDYVIIDNNGMGYYISMPLTEIDKIKNNMDIVKIFIYQHVREDNISLFGFLSKENLSMFKMLINVSGVGPKAGLAIVCAINPNELALAIISDDEKALCRAQGVGKKLAQRIILELKDKFKNYDFIGIKSSQAEGSSVSTGDGYEAIEALMTLGYTRSEAAIAINAVDKSKSVEEMVKQALKSLMRG